jgi:hypothetical protein
MIRLHSHSIWSAFLLVRGGFGMQYREVMSTRPGIRGGESVSIGVPS